MLTLTTVSITQLIILYKMLENECRITSLFTFDIFISVSRNCQKFSPRMPKLDATFAETHVFFSLLIEKTEHGEHRKVLKWNLK